MQVERAYRQYCSRGDALAKNTFMTSMKEQNEVLYYKVRALMYLYGSSSVNSHSAYDDRCKILTAVFFCASFS